MELKAEPDSTQLGKPSLFAGMIGAPLVWLTQFLINYALVPYVCHTRKFFALHLTTFIALLLISVAFVLSYRDWQRTAGHPAETQVGGRIGTARLTAFVGMTTSILTFLLTFGQGIATFMVDPCAN